MLFSGIQSLNRQVLSKNAIELQLNIQNFLFKFLEDLSGNSRHILWVIKMFLKHIILLSFAQILHINF